MKAKYFLFLFGLVLSLISCQIDNYDEPDAFFTGQVLYQGDTIRVGANEVYFELYQPSYQLDGPFNVNLDLDGSFSGRLFSGDYKLTFVDGQGPFKANNINQQGDTLDININGNTKMDLEVMPYYMVRNPQFSKSGNTVNATIALEQIVTGTDARNVEAVTLFLNKTTLVSNAGDYNIAQANGDFSDLNSINISVNIPDGYTDSSIFARVGVRIAGVEDMIFSPVQKLDL